MSAQEARAVGWALLHSCNSEPDPYLCTDIVTDPATAQCSSPSRHGDRCHTLVALIPASAQPSSPAEPPISDVERDFG